MEWIKRRIFGSVEAGSVEAGSVEVEPDSNPNQNQLNSAIPINNIEVETIMKETGQRIPVGQQHQNSAGGYSFKVCDMIRLKRFLVFGFEENTFYATSEELSLDNVKCIGRLLQKGHGQAVLQLIEDYGGHPGRVPKMEPVLLALAMCASCPLPDIQKLAYEKVTAICNYPTKLFIFLEYCQRKINADRKIKAPEPQRSKKRPHIDDLSEMNITSKKPTENIDESTYPSPAKKQKRNEKRNRQFKVVNTAPKQSSGWGRMRRRGISSFYTSPEPERLLLMVTKFKQRKGWSHKQVLGYAHPKVDESDEHKMAKDYIFTYVTRGYKTLLKKYKEHTCNSRDLLKVKDYIDILEEINDLKPDEDGAEDRLLELLEKHGKRDEHEDFSVVNFGQEKPLNPDGKRAPFHIVREHIPTSFLNSVKVWELLLKDMPMTAMIRNLGKMSSIGLFKPNNPNEEENVTKVTEALLNVKRLEQGFIHPIKILIASYVYSTGKGDKGSLSWSVNDKIKEALDKAFYLSFKAPTVKEKYETKQKYMLCIDVSGSMTWQGCFGCELLSPALASIAMAMVTLNLEEHVDIMAFGEYFQSLNNVITRDMKLLDALAKTRNMNFGRTDCSLPMEDALRNKKDVDVFIVYTDSETWFGNIHPHKALQNYNTAMGKYGKQAAKLIVCAMQSNNFTIADPSDPNMLDICGFDANVPDIIANFAAGSSDEKCTVCKECQTNNMK